MADYFSYAAPAKRFVGDTEEGALEALAKYLEETPPLQEEL